MRSLLVGLVAGAALVGCQTVLGDFEVGEFEPGALGSVCRPNSYRCQGARLERCRDNRTGFEPVTTCESAGMCDPSAGTCRTCSVGEFACSDGELRTCSGDAAWSNATQCETAALCRVNPDRGGGTCDPPQCETGSFLCEGGWLLACAPTRDRWNLVEYCGADAICDAATAAAAVEKKERPHCVPTCGDDCPPGACRPGATRCSRDLPAVELCASDGQWIIREACATDALCDGVNGRCLQPACNFGDMRCFGNLRQVCSQDQTRFETIEECPASGTCAPDDCEAARCTDGALRCNGSSFERCLEGEFVPVNRCATRVLCNPATGCQPPMCGEELEHHQCSPDGSSVRSCLPGRNDWRESACLTGTICDPLGGLCVQMP